MVTQAQVDRINAQTKRQRESLSSLNDSNVIVRDQATKTIINTSDKLNSLIGRIITPAQSNRITRGNYKITPSGIKTGNTMFLKTPLSVRGQDISPQLAKNIALRNQVVSREADKLGAVINARGYASERDKRLANILANAKIENERQITKYNDAIRTENEKNYQQYFNQIEQQIGRKPTAKDILDAQKPQEQNEQTPILGSNLNSDDSYTFKTGLTPSQIENISTAFKNVNTHTVNQSTRFKIGKINTFEKANISKYQETQPKNQKQYKIPYKFNEQDAKNLTDFSQYNFDTQSKINSLNTKVNININKKQTEKDAKIDIPNYQTTINRYEEKKIENNFGIKKEKTTDQEYKILRKMNLGINPKWKESMILLNNKYIIKKLQEKNVFDNTYDKFTGKQARQLVLGQLSPLRKENWYSKEQGIGTLPPMIAYTVGMGVADRLMSVNPATNIAGYTAVDVIDPLLSVPEFVAVALNPNPINKAIAMVELVDFAENFIPYSNIHLNAKKFFKTKGINYNLPNYEPENNDVAKLTQTGIEMKQKNGKLITKIDINEKDNSFNRILIRGDLVEIISAKNGNLNYKVLKNGKQQFELSRPMSKQEIGNEIKTIKNIQKKIDNTKLNKLQKQLRKEKIERIKKSFKMNKKGEIFNSNELDNRKLKIKQIELQINKLKEYQRNTQNTDTYLNYEHTISELYQLKNKQLGVEMSVSGGQKLIVLNKPEVKLNTKSDLKTNVKLGIKEKTALKEMQKQAQKQAQKQELAKLLDLNEEQKLNNKGKLNYKLKQAQHLHLNTKLALEEKQNLKLNTKLNLNIKNKINLKIKKNPIGNDIAYLPIISNDIERIKINKKFLTKQQAEQLGMYLADITNAYKVNTKKVKVTKNSRLTQPIKWSKPYKFTKQGKTITEKSKFRNDTKFEWRSLMNRPKAYTY